MAKFKSFLVIVASLLVLTGMMAISSDSKSTSQRPSEWRLPLPVTVVNTPTMKAIPLGMTAPMEPFKKSVEFILPHNGDFVGNNSNIFVPSGKRLVVEHVSAFGSTLRGGQITCIKIFSRAGTHARSSEEWHYLTLHPTAKGIMHDADGGEISFHYFSASEPMRMYADGVDYPTNEYGGAQVVIYVTVFCEGSRGNTEVKVTVSGYLVDIPQSD